VARLIPSGRARIATPIERDAHAGATRIRERAHADAGAIADAARREGEAAAESKAIGAMLELAAQAADIREGASREIATLALEVASRVIREAVALEPALIERIVLRTLARAKDEARVVLALHPEDRALVVRGLEAKGGVPESIRIVDAPDQLRGGCVVSNERIRIDARVESAIAAIAHAMGVDPPAR
jgi:flagellar assembly protein FliH